MKLNIKDYIMIIIIILILLWWLYLLQEKKYNHEHSLINQKYCLDLWIWDDKEISDITKCNLY